MNSIRKMLAGNLLAGATLVAASGFAIAYAQDTAAPSSGEAPSSGGHEWHHHHGGPWRMYGKLGLTDDQKASMKAIMRAAKPQMQSLHEQMRANQTKLMQTAPGSANYSTVVAEVAQANATLASQRTTQGAELRTQLEAVLSDAQKTQLSMLRAQWAAKAAAQPAAE